MAAFLTKVLVGRHDMTGIVIYERCWRSSSRQQAFAEGRHAPDILTPVSEGGGHTPTHPLTYPHNPPGTRHTRHKAHFTGVFGATTRHKRCHKAATRGVTLVCEMRTV